MDETEFHTLADATLERYFAALDGAYDSGALDELELQNGILTLVTANGKTFLVTKHAPTRQLWLASPISGGSHFSWSASAQAWQLADGASLADMLRHELATHEIVVTL